MNEKPAASDTATDVLAASDTPTTLAIALDLADQGLPVFPCHRHDKSPAVTGGFQAATIDHAQIRRWFAGTDHLIGVPTGAVSGIDAVDIDPRHGGDTWLAGVRMPLTRTHDTRSGGAHFLFQHSPGMRCSVGRIAPGVDVRADGGYIIWWPCSLDEPPAPWPDWLLGAARAPAARTIQRRAADLAPPSAAHVVRLLQDTPNPETLGRDEWNAVMLSAVGCIAGLAAADRLQDGDAEAIRDAALAWSAKWPGADPAADEEKWESDWSTRTNDLAGWPHLLRMASKLGTPSAAPMRAESAAAEFEPLPAAAPEDEPTKPTQPEYPDAWRSMLQLNDKGNPRAILANADIAFRHAHEWRGVVALDAFASRIMLRKPPPWHSGPFSPRALSDADRTRAAVWLQAAGIAVSSAIAGEALAAVADENRYHPLRDLLLSFRHDGTPRAETWLRDYLGAEDTPYTRAVSRAFLISAVARALRPGCKVDTMLILEGRQGLRKSSACHALSFGLFTDHMPDLTSKDAALQLQGVWIVEFAELDTMHRSEASRYKAFLSTATDRLRKPYGSLTEDFPRGCVFVGTVNPNGRGYLADETGNRRFWPVACGLGWPDDRCADIPGLTAVREQLWAEAVALYQAGEPWWLNSAEHERAQQQATETRTDDDVWGERIREFIASRAEISVGDILVECLHKPAERWTAGDKLRVARVLVTAKWTRKQVRVGNSREWRYFNPTNGPVVTTLTGDISELVTAK